MTVTQQGLLNKMMQTNDKHIRVNYIDLYQNKDFSDLTAKMTLANRKYKTVKCYICPST